MQKSHLAGLDENKTFNEGDRESATGAQTPGPPR